MNFARTDQSVIAQWWWTVDRWTLLALAMLIGMGALMVMAASPAVAVRIGADSLNFVHRFFAFLPATLLTMFVVSLQSPRGIRRIAGIVFVVSLAALAYTLVSGVEIKGRGAGSNCPAFRSSLRNSSSRASPWYRRGCSRNTGSIPASPAIGSRWRSMRS